MKTYTCESVSEGHGEGIIIRRCGKAGFILPESGRVIIAADRVSASEIAPIRGAVAGAVLSEEGRLSHGTIYLKDTGIPVLISDKLSASLPEGIKAVISGDLGKLYLDPSDSRVKELLSGDFEILKQGERPPSQAVTLDGQHIELFSTIWDDVNLEQATAPIFSGIGLFRTEGILMSDEPPTYERQRKIYSAAGAAAGNRICTIRLFDLDDDKSGLAGIFGGSSAEEIFSDQIRAIISSSTSQTRILLPGTSSRSMMGHFVSAVGRIARDVAENSESVVIPKCGAMIETAAGVMAARDIAAKSSFIHIGLNGLIREGSRPYTFENEMSEATLLRMVRFVLDCAAKKGIPVTVCGEIDPQSEMPGLLIGLGVRRFSVSPRSVGAMATTISRISSVSSVTEAVKRAENFLILP